MHRQVLGRHASRGRTLAEREEPSHLLTLLGLHLLENRPRLFRGQLPQQVRGRVRAHLLDDVGGAIGIERLDDGDLRPGVQLFERAGRDLFIERLENGLALGRRQILDDVRDIGRVERRKPLIGDLELHTAGWIALEEIDEMPRNDPRGNPREQLSETVPGHDSAGEPSDGPPRADVDAEHGQDELVTLRPGVELHVVHPHQLPALDVDDLLVEQIPLQEQQILRRQGTKTARSSWCRRTTP